MSLIPPSFFSDEEVSENRVQPSAARQSAAANYVRQISDAGQETDVSQMSEDEPRSARIKVVYHFDQCKAK